MSSAFNSIESSFNRSSLEAKYVLHDDVMNVGTVAERCSVKHQARRVVVAQLQAAAVVGRSDLRR